jgi:hypothetical protein
MATPDTVTVVYNFEPFIGTFVARISDKPPRLEKGRRSQIIRISPKARARSATATAEDALVKSIQYLPFLRALKPLTITWRRRFSDQIGFDDVVLVEEIRKINDQIFNYRKRRKRLNNDRRF